MLVYQKDISHLQNVIDRAGVPLTTSQRLPSYEENLVKTLPRSEVHAWALARAAKVRRCLADLNAFQNGVVPVNRVPKEVLVRVLCYVRDAGEYMAWIPFISVCRHWRRLALSTPNLWNDIQVDEKRRKLFLTTCLERSKGSPIKICINDGVAGDDKLVEALAPYADTIVYLHILPSFHFSFMDKDKSKFTPHFNLVMPKLETLSLDMHGEQPLVPADGQFPRLRSLSLRCLPVPWDSSIFAPLVELKLEGGSEKWPELTLDELVDLLARCGSLERLTLIKACPPTSEAASAAQRLRHPVAAPKLRYLSVNDTLDTVTALLAALELSPSCVLSLNCRKMQARHEAITIAEVLPRCEWLSALVASIQSLDVRVTTEVHVLARTTAGVADEIVPALELKLEIVNRSSDGLRFGKMADLLPSILGELSTIFAAATLATLHVSGNMAHVDVERWCSTLASFPSLQKLLVRCDGHLKTLFEALGCHSWVQDVLCPRLNTLVILITEAQDDAIEQEMLQALSDRASSGLRLGKLLISDFSKEDMGFTDGFIENLNAVVGEVVIKQEMKP